MEKIDFEGREVDPGDLLKLVANKVQEIVEWINRREWIDRHKPGGA